MLSLLAILAPFFVPILLLCLACELAERISLARGLARSRDLHTVCRTLAASLPFLSFHIGANPMQSLFANPKRYPCVTLNAANYSPAPTTRRTFTPAPHVVHNPAFNAAAYLASCAAQAYHERPTLEAFGHMQRMRAFALNAVY